MIVEYVRYELPPEHRQEFEDAYRSVGHLIGESPYCLGWELRRSVEDPTHYVVRMEWTSRADHETGFRKSPQFSDFFSAVRRFAPYRREMSHFEVVAPGGPQ